MYIQLCINIYVLINIDRSSVPSAPGISLQSLTTLVCCSLALHYFLAAANDAKRGVMRHLFHELRSPLNTIVLAIEDVLTSPTLAVAATSPAAEGTFTSEYGMSSAAKYSGNDRNAYGIATTSGPAEMSWSQRELLEIAATSARMMPRLLNDFLSFEKVEAGKLELELEDVEPRALLEESVHAFIAPMAHRALTATIVVDDRLPRTFQADPHRCVPGSSYI